MRKKKSATVKTIRTFDGKKYKLYPTGFTTKRAAEQVAKTIRKHPRVKSVRIILKNINRKRIYLIYLR